MNKIIAIAIDEYLDPTINNLKNCLNDTNAIIDILSKRYQFDSIELYAGIEQTSLSFLYNSLYDELINSLEGDNILIIYAGHGEYNSTIETSYWLCSDSLKNNITGWFNVNDLLSFFKAARASHIALISDSCFSGAIFEVTRGGGIAALESKKSRQALTSGGLEKVSDGKENHNSPFNIALQSILNGNNKDILSFNELSENTIIEFDEDNYQTPTFGALVDSGHKGGTFIFKLNKLNKENIIKEMQLPLEISNSIKIESDLKIPFFNENEKFNSLFINAFVQQLGYSIINDARVFVTEDKEYSIERSKEFGFELNVSYSIESLSDRFLSILLTRYDYFGGVHPNHYVYSLNFAFKPDRKLSLNDILDYSEHQNLEEFLRSMVEKYAQLECKGILIEYTTYEHLYNLEFTFNETSFTIYYLNLFPHAFKGCGYLEIPIFEIKFKDNHN